MARSQAAVDCRGAAFPVRQHGTQLLMAGLGNARVGNYQVAKGIENVIDLPLQSEPTPPRDSAKIAGHGAALTLQHQKEDQSGNRR
jgi:hypothetical protein